MYPDTSCEQPLHPFQTRKLARIKAICMLTGVSYMGHHHPRYLAADFAAMRQLELDDVFLCLQENDFRYYTGKVKFAPELAQATGLRPLAILWGALNLFGGGRASQHLLENPDGHQQDRAGNPLPAGCYVNEKNVAHIQSLITVCAEVGYAGYFVDEPVPLNCYCEACRTQYDLLIGGDLVHAAPADEQRFRHHCVLTYIKTMATYCKTNHPQLETFCCLMPSEQAMWAEASALDALDNIGTDIYWGNNDRNLAEMRPLLTEIDTLARANGKRHHEWLHGWGIKAGREPRIIQMGDEIIHSRPDALYVWAWEGQIGMSESCDDPLRAWAAVTEVIKRAQDIDHESPSL